jgi:hypothetical protein
MPGHDVDGSVNTSLRHFGRLRSRLNPATFSDTHAIPGTVSRAFISHGAFVAYGA